MHFESMSSEFESVAIVQAIRKEYAAAESVQELSVDFEEGDALTLDNVSVEGTTTSGGWHVATKWDPARVSSSTRVPLFGLLGATVNCVHN